MRGENHVHELPSTLLDALAYLDALDWLVPWEWREAVTVVGKNPPEHAVSIGGDHFIERMYYEGGWVGIHEWHKTPAGEWCVGWIPFANTAWKAGGETWDVQSLDPLTISPSLLCRGCGSHGFIRGGVWVQA